MDHTNQWIAWIPDQSSPVMEIDNLSPVLASWDHKGHPSQIRLRAFTNQLMERLDPLPQSVHGLFLDLEVDVLDKRNLLRGHDLENYLTPLFGSGCLPAPAFRLVSASKHVGGGSRLRIGAVKPGES